VKSYQIIIKDLAKIVKGGRKRKTRQEMPSKCRKKQRAGEGAFKPLANRSES
jgi:hypothetical protein